MIALWNNTAWVWPHVASSVATVAAFSFAILAAIALTRWRVLKGTEARLPLEAQDRIMRARRAAAHYRELYEREQTEAARLRATIRGSIGTAAATIQQLEGGTR